MSSRPPTYHKLIALKNSLNESLSGYGANAEMCRGFNSLLDDLISLGYDVAAFKIGDAELKNEWCHSSVFDDAEGFWSGLHLKGDLFRAKLEAVIGFLDDEFASRDQANGMSLARNSVVENCCSNFGNLVVRMGQRQRGRAPLVVIDDEYDVQDLLHGVLTLFFDDIRPEEWTPSYAGSATRMDFLLPELAVVIEVKYARESKDVKRIGDEVIVDVTHYATHPKCNHMFVLIYDPKRVLSNPRGIEKDLQTQKVKENPIRVFIVY